VAVNFEQDARRSEVEKNTSAVNTCRLNFEQDAPR